MTASIQGGALDYLTPEFSDRLEGEFQRMLNSAPANEWLQLIACEHDRDVLRAYELRLKDVPLRVHQASSRNEAIALLRSLKTGVLVTDLRFEEESEGHQTEKWLMTEVLRERSNLKVLVFSGWLDDLQNPERLRELGVGLYSKGDSEAFWTDLRTLPLRLIFESLARRSQTERRVNPVVGLNEQRIIEACRGLFETWLGSLPSSTAVIVGKRRMGSSDLLKEWHNGSEFGREIFQGFVEDMEESLGQED